LGEHYQAHVAQW